MKATKHDLSGNLTKLYWPDLVRVVNIATGYSKSACERSLSQAQYASLERDYSTMASAARELAANANALAIACETLHVITEAEKREELSIVERPAPIGN